MGLTSSTYMMEGGLGDSHQNAAMANQRTDQTLYKGKGKVEHLDFGLISHRLPTLPPHSAISQTPRLKASTFKSPILGHAVVEPVKRANSLLDHDLAFMNTSVLQDQDELPQGKWDGSDHLD